MRMLFPLKAQNTENAISFLNYRPLRKELHVEAKNEVHAIIARRHGFDPSLDDAFMDWDTIDGAIRVGKIFDAMDYFLGVVGLVTLGLGAIGIINIMLVSVTERTREIGLRKALGATHRNILTQFFVEGAFLTVFSGGIGLAISGAFVTLLAQLPSPEGFDTPRIVPASAVVAIISLSVAGIVAGLYPARKAALLPPVEALRQEEGNRKSMLTKIGKQAFNALKHNRRRSVLTMLGMAWGIATVVLLLAYGSGFQNALMIAFRTFGGNLVAIFPGALRSRREAPRLACRFA